MHDMLTEAVSNEVKIIGLAEVSKDLDYALMNSFSFQVYHIPHKDGERCTAILVHDSLVPNVNPKLNWAHDSGRATAVVLSTSKGLLPVVVM